MQSPGSLLKRLKESSFTVKLLCASADNDHVTDDQGHPRGGKKGKASCKNEDDGDNSKDLLNIHWFSFRGPFFSVGGGADEQHSEGQELWKLYNRFSAVVEEVFRSEEHS